MTTMSTHGNGTAPQHGLAQARGHLDAATRALATAAPGPHELHAIVDGAMRTCTALADFVATLLTQVPAALDGYGGPDRHLLRELEYDLRAMHGCLTTAPLLLAPARDDLHTLTASVTETVPAGDAGDADHTEETRMFDETFDKAPTHDVAAQQQPAYPDHDDDPASGPGTVVDDGAADVLEADPADVSDQHRPAPVLADDEPWP
jgi:hypothetical protein